MEYNQDEKTRTTVSDQQQAAPDSPAAYGINRYSSEGTSSASGFGTKKSEPLGPLESYKLFWTNYLNFNDRSRRSEYWWPILFNNVIGLVLYALAMSSIDLPMEQFANMPSEQLAEVLMSSGMFWLWYGLLGAFGLATCLPTIALAVRRLHDRGITGWLYAIMLLNCLCGIPAIVLIVIFCLDSKPETNKWGPSPKYE